MLERMDEIRSQAYLNMATIQKWCKTYYNIKTKSKILTTEDLILFYDNQFKKNSKLI